MLKKFHGHLFGRQKSLCLKEANEHVKLVFKQFL